MSWTRRIWQNFPSLSTAISASALNNIEEGVEEAVTATRGRLSDANLSSTYGSVASVAAKVPLTELPVLPSSADKTGATNAQPALQAAIDAAYATVIAAQKAANSDAVNIPITRDVEIPAGLYRIDSSLTMRPGVSLRLSHAAVVRAGAAMGAMLDSSPTTLLQRSSITGGVWDCNALAQTAINLRWSIAFRVGELRVNDPLRDGILIGDPNSTSPSYEATVQHVDLYRPRGTASPIETRVVSSGVTFTDSGDIVTIPAHGLAVGDTVVFGTITSTTGVLAATTYYVRTIPTSDTVTLSATLGGSTLALTTDGSAASATMTRGYAGVWMRNVTDSYVAEVVPRGFAVGVRNDGGSNSFFRAHSWNPTGQAGPAICFDDNGSNSQWIDCYADSPSGIGFRFRGSNGYSMTNCTLYMGASGADNTAYGIQCDGNPFLSVRGGQIYGADGTHRWKQDIYVTGGGPSSLNIKFDPSRSDFGTVVTRTFSVRTKMHALVLTPGSDAGAVQVEGASGDFFRGYNSGNTLVSVLNANGGVQPGNGTAVGAAIYSGSGAPSSGLGANGDFYLRTDTPTTANQRLYVKASGSWSGIL